jgi:D-alanyl-D-alanine carboxypeptidase (penicillin-binding protein 5/6)
MRYFFKPCPCKKNSSKSFKKPARQFFLKSVFLSIFFIFTLLALIGASIFIQAGELFADNSPDVTAEAAIIVECKTQDILWQKNPDAELFPASLTKIMTCIVALEQIQDLNEIIKMPKMASSTNNSFFPLRTGDEISLGDLIKAALINSHNNATIALAIHLSGSEEEFVKLMNEKAREIGAFHTNFQNTNGLDSNSPQHKTTARDLALIADYSMKNDTFRQIVSKKEDNITINGEEIYLFNTNILLFFDYIKGIKTGFTNNAGYCEALFSSREGLEIISVVLKSQEGKRESDMLNMINWANENYVNKKIIDKNEVYSRALIRGIKNDESYSYNTNIYTETYPASSYEKLVNINDRVDISGEPLVKDIDFKSKALNNNSKTVNVLSKGDEAGKINIEINGRPEKDFAIVYGQNVDKPVVNVNLEIKKDNRFRNTLILLISFYFFIFILIIFKNLLLRSKE